MQQILSDISYSPKIQSKFTSFHQLYKRIHIEICCLNVDRYLCIASGREVAIYSVELGDKLFTLDEHKVEIVGLAVKDGTSLYSSDTFGNLLQWTIANGTLEEVHSLIN